MRQHGPHRVFRARSGLDQFRHQMRDHFGIGIAFKGPAALGQRVTQLLEILDDPIVDQRQHLGGMWVGIGRCRRAVGGPAGVGDPGCAGRGIARQLRHQPLQFARRTAADQFAAMDRANPGAIIAAVFHPPQPIDQPLCHRVLADDADNTAHEEMLSLESVGNADARHSCRKILCISCNKDASAGLRSGKDDGIHGLQALPFAPQGRSPPPDFSIDFIDTKA